MTPPCCLLRSSSPRLLLFPSLLKPGHRSVRSSFSSVLQPLDLPSVCVPSPKTSFSSEFHLHVVPLLRLLCATPPSPKTRLLSGYLSRSLSYFSLFLFSPSHSSSPSSPLLPQHASPSALLSTEHRHLAFPPASPDRWVFRCCPFSSWHNVCRALLLYLLEAVRRFSASQKEPSMVSVPESLYSSGQRTGCLDASPVSCASSNLFQARESREHSR